MRKYTVTLSRGYLKVLTGDLELEANNETEAKEKALDLVMHNPDEVINWRSNEGEENLQVEHVKEIEQHDCVFSFEKKYVGKVGSYEPKLGETGFSNKRSDWICRCGKTRREYLKRVRAWVL